MRALKKGQEKKSEVAEMQIIRWMSNYSYRAILVLRVLENFVKRRAMEMEVGRGERSEDVIGEDGHSDGWRIFFPTSSHAVII